MAEPPEGPVDTDHASVLASILEASTEYSIVATQLDGTFLIWNEGDRRLSGYDATETLGRNIRMLHTVDDVAAGKVDEILASALAHGEWEGVFHRVRKGGLSFPTRI